MQTIMEYHGLFRNGQEYETLACVITTKNDKMLIKSLRIIAKLIIIKYNLHREPNYM